MLFSPPQRCVSPVTRPQTLLSPWKPNWPFRPHPSRTPRVFAKSSTCLAPTVAESPKGSILVVGFLYYFWGFNVYIIVWSCKVQCAHLSDHLLLFYFLTYWLSFLFSLLRATVQWRLCLLERPLEELLQIRVGKPWFVVIMLKFVALHGFVLSLIYCVGYISIYIMHFNLTESFSLCKL